MSQINTRRKKLNKSRYNLHYRLKMENPIEAETLNPGKRTFTKMPESNIGKKLVNKYGYVVLVRMK